MSTIKDVADRAEVSTATVYKVFSKKYNTSRAIANKVMRAARELNYTNHSGDMDKSKDIHPLIAVVINEVMNGFYNRLVSEMLREMRRYGYQLTVFYSNGDVEREFECLESIANHKYDAVIYQPIQQERVSLVEEMIRSDVPIIILFSRMYPELDTIVFDDKMGTYNAVKYFTQNNHKRILMVAINNFTTSPRIDGYKKALEEAHIPFDSKFIYLGKYAVLSKDTLKTIITQTKPTAILSVSENVTAFTIQALSEMSLSVPEDISLIAYDDFAWLSAYGVSAVYHPLDQLGTLLTQLLHDRITETGSHNRQPPNIYTFDPKLIARNTVLSVKQ